MASKVFEIRTKPHEAVFGDTTVFFEPEVIGAEFAAAYDKLREAQKRAKAAEGGKASSTKHAKEADVDAETLVSLSTAMREFVGSFVTTESVADFSGLRLPDRILLEMVNWVAELYGGGSGNPAAAGGTSSD